MAELKWKKLGAKKLQVNVYDAICKHTLIEGHVAGICCNIRTNPPSAVLSIRPIFHDEKDNIIRKYITQVDFALSPNLTLEELLKQEELTKIIQISFEEGLSTLTHMERGGIFNIEDRKFYLENYLPLKDYLPSELTVE